MEVVARHTRARWVLVYSVCSLSLLLTNKLALTTFPAPNALTCLQLLTSSLVLSLLVVYSGHKKTDHTTLALFGIEASCFSLGLLANMKALLYTSVGAVIAARSCLPLLVLSLEVVTRRAASVVRWRSMLCLAGVAAFACGFAFVDPGLMLSGSTGIFWLLMYDTILAFQVLYGKWLIGRVPMSHLQRALYTNSFGLPLSLCMFHSSKEYGIDSFVLALRESTLMISITCFLGFGISYSSWRLRAMVEASTFSLIGVVNKMLTVIISSCTLDAQSSSIGIMFLLGCIACAFFYERLN